MNCKIFLKIFKCTKKKDFCMKLWVEKAVRTPLGVGVCDSKGKVTS